MKAVIMAGGKGTRIQSVASDIPKPMIKIGGVPILEREVRSLVEQGFSEIIITVSHLGQIIMDYFGDGEKFGAKISYFDEKEPLGNAGALFRLKDELQNEPFLLLNGDVLIDVDFSRMISFHEKTGGLATILTHPNSHPYDSGLIITDEDKSVKTWLTKEDARPKYYKNRVNAGVHILEPKIFELYHELENEKVDLDRQILRPLAGKHLLFAYDSPEYIKDMGTPDRYEQVQNDQKKDIPRKKNLMNKQKAIFLDRDGTINQKNGFVRDAEGFFLLPGVSETIKKINQTEYLCIVITNQPVIARGEATVEQLEEIHNKMETLLGQDGAYLDAIYYCPHHPDGGFPGEVKELKIDCDCRKPKPGMLLKAAEDYNIDLSQSWMIGDSERDVLAGKNAGCKTALVNNIGDFGQDRTINNINDFVI